MTTETDAAPEVLTVEKVEGLARREPLLLTICEAAELLSVGRTTAYRLIDDGELEVVRIGRSARVPRSAVVDFVERLRAQ